MVAMYVYYNFTTGIDDLFLVLEAVASVIRWFDLGLALGLKQPTLQIIRDQHQPSDHKREMLTKWLHQVDGCRPTWNALVIALRSRIVQCYTVAEEIEQSHPHVR